MIPSRAFTLIEVIVVIAIIGLLAALAIPRLSRQQEVGRLSEAVQALDSFYGAQKRYELDHGACTADCNNLDVTLTPRNYTMSCLDTCAVWATKAGQYRITKNPAGAFSCADLGASTDCTYLARYLP